MFLTYLFCLRKWRKINVQQKFKFSEQTTEANMSIENLKFFAELWHNALKNVSLLPKQNDTPERINQISLDHRFSMSW